MAVVEEWDDVATITPKLNEPADYAAKTCTSLVTFQEAYDHFTKSDLSQHLVRCNIAILCYCTVNFISQRSPNAPPPLLFFQKQIQPLIEKHGLSAVFSMFFGPPKLRPNLEAERDTVFAIAQCKSFLFSKNLFSHEALCA